MKIHTHPLIVLHGDPAFRDRLRSIADREFSLRFVPDWASLPEAICESPPSAVLVVDPYAGSARRDTPAPELRSLLDLFPSTTVFAAMDVRPDQLGDLRALGEWGVAEVVTLGHDDTPTALRHRFRAARGRPLKLLLAPLLPADLSGRARAIVDAAAETVVVGGNADELARRFRMSRRTLLRWNDRVGLPPPRRLLAWMRLLLAAELLNDPGRSIGSVAQACGYSADSGLRRVTKQFLGMSPTQLREPVSFARVAREVARLLDRRRGENTG
jgi:AraC-like DNA-binding protein